ncbi:MAG: PQQ-binding-like beta-propeller repeat protein, partial [Planctomycetota bacterium]
MLTRKTLWYLLICTLFCSHIVTSTILAADQPQWGQRYSRNMVSSETGLPETFDPDTGKNIKWIAPLGTQTYSTPVIGSGKILIGTNNDKPRDPRHKGDRGVLLCLDEMDGSLCWQLIVPKLGKDRFIDWPRVGMCSVATIEGDRAYILSNKGEVICLDLNGQANGNDGPYMDEGRHMAPNDVGPMKVAKTDADIIWLFDAIGEMGVHVHD